MNIVIMRTILAKAVNEPVIPIDSPVVPKAEHTSKKISINENESLTEMRIVDKQEGILDGEAIYLSVRAIENMTSPNKGTLSIHINNDIQPSALNTIAVLADALMNNATKKQSEVLFYKLLSVKEEDIAEKLGISQPGVNSHSSSAKWYCIEEALNYFEQIKFENYE